MLKYLAVFSFEVGGGHTPLSLSCYTTLLLVELETRDRDELHQLQLQKEECDVQHARERQWYMIWPLPTSK